MAGLGSRIDRSPMLCRHFGRFPPKPNAPTQAFRKKHVMTHEEHRKKLSSMLGVRTRKRNAMKAAKSLADKLAILQDIKRIDEEIRMHRLSYFDLVMP